MTRVSQLVAACALCALLASYACAAQSANPPKSRTVPDPAAQELNRLLASAQEALDRQDYAAAAQNYQDYLAKKPDDAIVHYDLGYAYTGLQRPSDAKAEYEKAISLAPKMPAAYLNLGLTLMSTDPKAAVEPLQHAVELMPGEARPLLYLATALERSGQLPEAVRWFQAAAKLDERNYAVQFALGRALLAANRPPEAEAAFRAALALRSDAGEAHLGLARSLNAQKKPEAAAAELAAYLQTNPDDPVARLERAAALVELGKPADALRELDAAAPRGSEGLGALKLRAQIYFAEKRYADAVPPLEKAAALAPDDKNLAVLLGHAYLESKKYPEALRALVAAYRLDREAPDVQYDLALAEYYTKNYTSALNLLDNLSTHVTLSPPGWFIRADCYDNLGRKAEALESYAKFLQLNKEENSDMYFEASARVRTLTRELREKR